MIDPFLGNRTITENPLFPSGVGRPAQTGAFSTRCPLFRPGSTLR
jgi:hypothetical protein